MIDGATIEHAIDARGLVRRFGEKVAVDDVDLIVGQGEIYGFLGPNGAGKRSIVMTGWDFTDIFKAFAAIALVRSISFTLAFTALRGRVKRS